MNRWWASRPVGVQESDPVLGGPLFPSLDQMTSHVMWFPVGAMRMGDMGQSAEFGKFLKAMRSRMTPQMAGLTSNAGTRRVPGLRREEIARLADVSTDYYTTGIRG
jgi:hypothetical protein